MGARYPVRTDKPLLTNIYNEGISTNVTPRSIVGVLIPKDYKAH